MKARLVEGQAVFDALDDDAKAADKDGWADEKASINGKVGADGTEEKKIPGLWDLYNAWLTDKYEQWTKDETKDFGTRWGEADT